MKGIQIEECVIHIWVLGGAVHRGKMDYNMGWLATWRQWSQRSEMVKDEKAEGKGMENLRSQIIQIPMFI